MESVVGKISKDTAAVGWMTSLFWVLCECMYVDFVSTPEYSIRFNFWYVNWCQKHVLIENRGPLHRGRLHLEPEPQAIF